MYIYTRLQYPYLYLYLQTMTALLLNWIDPPLVLLHQASPLICRPLPSSNLPFSSSQLSPPCLLPHHSLPPSSPYCYNASTPVVNTLIMLCLYTIAPVRTIPD